MTKKKTLSCEILDGIMVTTYDDGSETFTPVDQTKITDNRSLWQKFKDWLTAAPITPYAKIRDLADPFGDRDDMDKGSDGKSAAEIGIKVKF